jgi:hypothetical protein
MISLNDIAIIEGHCEADELKQACAIQRFINAGQWSFQGTYGRTMMAAIDAGVCLLGPNPARDYYGNRIPSRDEVKPGTKGSRDYVVENFGEDWATALEALS